MGNQQCCCPSGDTNSQQLEVDTKDVLAPREAPPQDPKDELVEQAPEKPATLTTPAVASSEPAQTLVPEENNGTTEIAGDNPDVVLESDAAPETKSKEPMQLLWEKYSTGDMSVKEKDFLKDKETSQARRASTLQTSFPDYARKHSAFFEKLLAMESNDGWVLKKTVDSTDIYTKSVAGESLLYTKGVATMKTYGNGIRHLVSYLLTAEDRPKYDDECGYGATIESYMPYYRVVYFQMKTPSSIITRRDVLTLSRIRFEEDGSLLIATQSHEHSAVPADANFVRVTLAGGYIIRPTADPDEFKIIFAVQADPNGWLPGWVKALVAWKAQLMLGKFKQFYEQQFSK